MLQDKDRIFTNLYGYQDFGLKAAQKRGDWDKTAALMKVGQDAIIEQVLIALIARGHVLIEGVPGLGKTLQGLEDNMMSGVFPRQGGERRFFLQIFCILCGKTLPPKQEPAFFPDLVAVEVELPRTVPPEMGFDLDGLP